jgi:hypothetical protein
MRSLQLLGVQGLRSGGRTRCDHMSGLLYISVPTVLDL